MSHLKVLVVLVVSIFIIKLIADFFDKRGGIRMAQLKTLGLFAVALASFAAAAFDVYHFNNSLDRVKVEAMPFAPGLYTYKREVSGLSKNYPSYELYAKVKYLVGDEYVISDLRINLGGGIIREHWDTIEDKARSELKKALNKPVTVYYKESNPSDVIGFTPPFKRLLYSGIFEILLGLFLFYKGLQTVKRNKTKAG